MPRAKKVTEAGIPENQRFLKLPKTPLEKKSKTLRSKPVIAAVAQGNKVSSVKLLSTIPKQKRTKSLDKGYRFQTISPKNTIFKH